MDCCILCFRDKTHYKLNYLNDVTKEWMIIYLCQECHDRRSEALQEFTVSPITDQEREEFEASQKIIKEWN